MAPLIQMLKLIIKTETVRGISKIDSAHHISLFASIDRFDLVIIHWQSKFALLFFAVKTPIFCQFLKGGLATVVFIFSVNYSSILTILVPVC